MKSTLTTLTAGRTFPDISRLDWLQALITDYEEHLPGVDPDAESTMLSEVRGLLADLRTGSEAGRTLGRMSTPKKAAAARENGKRRAGTIVSPETRQRMQQAQDVRRERERTAKGIYCTGPRNGDWGYDDGVLPLEAARKYEGRPADADAWQALTAEDWNWSIDEAGLAAAGRLRALVVVDGVFRVVAAG